MVEYGACSSKSTDVPSSSEDEIDSNQFDTECLEPSPTKKRLTEHEKTGASIGQLQAFKIPQDMGREL